MKNLKNVQTYKHTILSILDEDKVRRRTPFEKDIKLNYVFPTSGKKFKLYRLLRQHILDVTKFITVLTEYELYTIERAIDALIVPDIFMTPIKTMIESKKNGSLVDSIVFGRGESFPLFQYEDESILDSYHKNPMMGKPMKIPAQLQPLIGQVNKNVNKRLAEFLEQQGIVEKGKEE